MHFNQLENMPVSLSIEEQNVKNSILRLNERLNGKLKIINYLFMIFKLVTGRKIIKFYQLLQK